MIQVKHMESIEKLFEGWQETLIWSCLQGCMGTAFANSERDPVSACIRNADFEFYAGVPDRELLDEHNKRGFAILVPQSKEWEAQIEETLFEQVEKTVRYAIKKEPEVFDKEKLTRIVDSVVPPYHLEVIDEKRYEQVAEHAWSRDFCSQFRDYPDFMHRGLGVVALEGDTVVSGASSYTVYNGGIEVEIDTQMEHRRKGLALACGAKLILLCLDRGWYPSWDAHNLGSVALAEKLGYHFDHEYTVYEWGNYFQTPAT